MGQNRFILDFSFASSHVPAYLQVLIVKLGGDRLETVFRPYLFEDLRGDRSELTSYV